jgi:hypothetical protein
MLFAYRSNLFFYIFYCIIEEMRAQHSNNTVFPQIRQKLTVDVQKAKKYFKWLQRFIYSGQPKI